MSRSSLASRALDLLLHQGGENHSEIRTLSLATLNDDDLLSTAALLWTQFGWFFALAVTGWLWILAFLVADLVLFTARWRLRRGLTLRGRPLDATSQEQSAWLNVLFITLIAIDVFVLTQAPSERAPIVAIVVASGFTGYIAALFSAFPVLATLNIFVLLGSLGLGLTIGTSDLVRPFVWLSTAGFFAYQLLIRRTHRSLLGAIRAQQTNRMLSLHDPLTKLPNRTFMRETLARLISRIGAREGPTTVAVLCLDLDGFKNVNDRFGRAAGDWVLVHVADILRAHLPSNDLVCRIGGDEYVVLLPGSDADGVRSVGRAIIATVASPFDIGRAISVRVGASLGGAITADRTKCLDDLIAEADAALYEAKRSGKGRVHIDAAA